MHAWLLVYKAANIPEAGMIEAVLAEYDIPTQMLGGALSGLGGEIAIADAQPEIWVPEKFYKEARKIIVSGSQNLSDG